MAKWHQGTENSVSTRVQHQRDPIKCRLKTYVMVIVIVDTLFVQENSTLM